MNAHLKSQLLSNSKSIPLYLRDLIFLQNSVWEFGRKLSHHYVHKGNGEDEEEIRKTKEDKNGSLYLYKSKGQHLLTNPRVLDTIVRKSAIKPTDTVLEIGPGTGNLTMRLLEVARKVVAVEVDKRMIEVLQKRVTEHGIQDRLTVICGDALKVEFPQFDLVVANIPYGISSPLVTKLVYGEIPFRSATLLLQKEFARRLLANPGDSEFNRLAVNVKLMAEVEFIMDVSKRDFVPCPKVDSSVVIIHPKADIPNVNLGEWRAFTRTCFNKKNKTLGATFKQKKKVIELLRLTAFNNDCMVGSNNHDYLENDEEESDKDDNPSFSYSDMEFSLFREKINGVLKVSGFEDKRPSKLSNEELLKLLSLLNQGGIYFNGKTEPKSDNINSLFTSHSM